MTQSLENIVTIHSLQDRYRFTKKLAAGGFCDVFHAVEKSGRPVAIKMMQTGEPDGMDGRRAARFRREMQLYGKLSHPNIVEVLDAGETETGLLYIVFEYIEGLTLGEVLRSQGALPVAKAWAVATQVLEALGAAHGKGIIHRDLKPENIMLIRSDSLEGVKVLDFGISTFMPSQWTDLSRLTLTGEFLGTPSYASPEQLRGEPVTARADIYAWGLVFLECLAGKPPFGAATVAGIVQHQLSPVPVPLPHPLMDHPLGTLLRWVLEKEPSRRAGNSDHVLERLRSVHPGNIPQENGYLPGPGPLPGHDQLDKAATGRSPTPRLERRQISVLCFSLNIESVSEQASIDVLDEIYHDLLQLCLEKVRELGGHVAGDSGGHLTVYFGFPQASDTDARRAMRAALVLSESLLRRSAAFTVQHGFVLAHQIGLHTGMVTVRPSGSDFVGISGVTPNLAARLCGAAPANSILISEDSHALLKSYLECEWADPGHAPSGSPAKRAYRVIGERASEGLIGLGHAAHTPLVGREFERDMILRSWFEVRKEGKGRIICLQGEAGLGKTRLAAECAIAIQREGQGAWMECRYSPENRNSPLFSILEFLRNHLGLAEKGRVPQGQQRDLEEKIFHLGMPAEEVMPLLCLWLGLPAGPHAAPPYSPQKIKELFLKNAATLMARLARAANAVIMMEDMHWIDPTSLELLPLLMEQVKKEGLLMIVSARPDFQPPWEAHDVETLELGALDGREVENLIVNALQGQAIEKDLLYSLVDRSGGVALFALELARMYLDRAKSRGAGRASETNAGSFEIPSSLRDLLAGRLDRLGPAKETAQLAAALGRTFAYNLLARVSWRDEALLLADLDQLVSEGLLHSRLRVGNPEYQFQHALVRDAAYESLAPKAKAEIHLRVAQTLDREFSELAGSQPEVFAMHWAGAGEFEKAVLHGTSAAASALSRSLNTEAILHSQSVLDWIQKTPAEHRNKSEMAINGILTQSMMFKFGWAYPQVKALAERSHELLKQMGNSEHSFPTLWALATYHHVASNRKKVRELTDEMDAFATVSQEKGLRVAADTFLGMRFTIDGDFTLAEKYLQSAIAGYDPQVHSNHGERFGLDTRVWSAATLALDLWYSGHDARAKETRELALAWAAETDHKPSIAINLMYRALAFQAMGEKQEVLETAGELVTMSEKYGLPAYSAYGGILLSWATGNIDQADAITGVLSNLGCRLCVPLYKSLAADNEAEKGNFAAAIGRLDNCINLCDELDEQFYKPYLHLRKGLLLGQMDGADRLLIRQSLDSAAQLARGNGMFRLEWYALNEIQRVAESPRNSERLEQIAKERPGLVRQIDSQRSSY